MTDSKRLGTSVLKSQETTWRSLKRRPWSQIWLHTDHHLNVALWDSMHRTQLRLDQTPDPGKFWDHRYCFWATESTVVWCSTTENEWFLFFSSFGNFHLSLRPELWGLLLQGACPAPPIYCAGSVLLPPTGKTALASFSICMSLTQ